MKNSEESKVIFDGEKAGYWAQTDYWAPEVHKYNGKFYLFGSGISKDRRRGTNIFVCDTVDGGHAMIFETLEGKRMISLHSPNKTNFERAAFYEF